MERRRFCGAFASALIAIPHAARAQQKGRVRYIGVLGPGISQTPAEIEEVRAPLGALGWIEGKNLFVERSFANNKEEFLRPFAEELVRLKVELIVTYGTNATKAAKEATKSIPIVIYSSGDPVAAGLVQSLAKPGGNITGISLFSPELDAKRLDYLLEALPPSHRVGDLENPNNEIFRKTRDTYEQAFRSRDMQPIFIEVATECEVENAVAEVGRRGGQALIVRGDGLFYSKRSEIMRAALRHQLPTFVGGRDYAEAGALLSYGPNLEEQRRRIVVIIDKILRGSKPVDLPIEQPTKFDLVINLKTAKALGLTIPAQLLERAHHVIQ